MARTEMALGAVVALAVAGALGGDLLDREPDARPVANEVAALEPRAVCEARQVGPDVEVAVRLQLAEDEALDMRADRALVVADLGTTIQTVALSRDNRSTGPGNHAVRFENLGDASIGAISVRASPSPDDPEVFRCDDSSVVDPTVITQGDLPPSGG